MRKINSLRAVIAAATIVIGASAFAESRPQNESWRDRDRDRNGSYEGIDRAYHDNDRVTLEGRVTSFQRESAGYRVQLGSSNYWFFLSESHLRNRRDFRVGISVRLSGVFHGGTIFVDSVSYPNGYGYDDGYDRPCADYRDAVRGVIDRIDYRRDLLVVRDERTGRFVTVEMRLTDPCGRIDADDLRRGDFVELWGGWSSGTFVAHRVAEVRSGGGYGHGGFRRY